jgi:hypothetical protein
MSTRWHERRRVIWPDALTGVLEVPLGAFMIAYGLMAPQTPGGRIGVEVTGLVTAAIGLAALRFGAAETIGLLVDVIELLPPIGGPKDHYPVLVYGFPFLFVGASCLAFALVLAATGGSERYGLPFLVAGIILLVLSLLVPLVRGIVKAIGGSAGEGKE